MALSWELFRANLGLSWAPWGHLEPSWDLLGTKSFLEPPVLNSLQPGFAVLRDFGGQFGPKIGPFFVIFGVLFWTSFWTLFGALLDQIWGFFLGADGPKMGQDGL